MSARTRCVAVGAILGLTWAAGVRGWMAELARGDSVSEVSRMTPVLVLLPGMLIGALLGWSAYLRSAGRQGSPWLAYSPALFAAALFDPEILHGLVTDGTGGGALIVVATALCIGDAVSRRGWSWRRVGCGLAGAAGLAMIWGIAGMAAPAGTPRGTWVSLYGATFVLLLGLAAVLPHPPTRGPLGTPALIGLGALCGLAWACALREFMAQVAAEESGVEWGLTFGYILLPGAVIGGLLGYAEARRRRGRRPRWPLVCSPLLFAAVLVPGLLDIDSMLEDGIGGGALGVPLFAMMGGLAVTGSARVWARALAGLGFAAGFTTWLLVASDVGGTAFSLDTVHGIWVSTLYESLLVTFALGAAVPHRLPPLGPRHVPGDVLMTSLDVR